ncbi:hypothetical protein AAHA92_19342 [Salvia divinorum]|uniref:Uncharacterized protein n=1 Tax=Salvia divinorum TaxID=28513 RepID=A0ABD1H505_SALDI
MEFPHAESRYNIESICKKVGLLVFDKKSYNKSHIVFNTRNLTQSIDKFTKIPSDDERASKGSPTLESDPIIRIPPHSPCLLSAYGLQRRRGHGNTTSGHQTLTLLPLTVCTEHGATSFLPLDYVQRMGGYTRTTYKHPISKEVHRFDDCVLEFPFPPPIGSSEEQSSELDYSRNCYQCFSPLSQRRTTYMDYLFCCNGCRLKACVTRYWYKKVMKHAEDFDEDSISFNILS